MSARRILLELFDAALRAVDGRESVSNRAARTQRRLRGVRRRQGGSGDGAGRTRCARRAHPANAGHHQGRPFESGTRAAGRRHHPRICAPCSGRAQSGRRCRIRARVDEPGALSHLSRLGRQLQSGGDPARGGNPRGPARVQRARARIGAADRVDQPRAGEALAAQGWRGGTHARRPAGDRAVHIRRSTRRSRGHWIRVVRAGWCE